MLNFTPRKAPLVLGGPWGQSRNRGLGLTYEQIFVCSTAPSLKKERLLVSAVVVLPKYVAFFLLLRAGHHPHAVQKQHPNVYKPAADNTVFAS